jgi:hypothetical protein
MSIKPVRLNATTAIPTKSVLLAARQKLCISRGVLIASVGSEPPPDLNEYTNNERGTGNIK